MEISNNKTLYLIEKEIELRKERRLLDMIKGMTDIELLDYEKRISKIINKHIESI